MAGIDVAGSQAIIIFGNDKVAIVMWVASIPLWAGLIYSVFTAFIIKECKPSLGAGINGGWLLSVVATQAVSSLGTLLSARFLALEPGILFFTFCMWLFGGMLYIWLISLIFYRYTFFHLSPAELVPTYWINMGAMAISTLAGTALIESSRRAPFLFEVLPFLKGFTMLYWATATWWIPMLVILGFWRHVYKKFSANIHSPILGCRISVGHVCRFNSQSVRCLECVCSGLDPAHLCVCRTSRVAGYFFWVLSGLLEIPRDSRPVKSGVKGSQCSGIEADRCQRSASSLIHECWWFTFRLQAPSATGSRPSGSELRPLADRAGPTGLGARDSATRQVRAAPPAEHGSQPSFRLR